MILIQDLLDIIKTKLVNLLIYRFGAQVNQERPVPQNALKEPRNVELKDKPSAELYEMIRKEKEHAQAFENTYDENSVVEFINTIASMLPNVCRVRMDVNEEYAKWCFQYEKSCFTRFCLK